MRVVFAGTPEPAATVLNHLLNSEHEVLAVITRPPARKGRGRTLHPSPVEEIATAHGIEVLRTSTLKKGEDSADAVRARLEELAPDCVPVVAYGALVPEDLLDVAPHGWINLHFSLLPEWRGAAPVQAALRAGYTTTGVSTFRIDAGLDTGPIALMQEYPIQASDTAETLLARLADQGAQVLIDTLSGLADGSITLSPQEGEGTYAGKITTEDARVSFGRSAQEIDCLIRAVTPHPGAWCELDGQRLKLGPLSLTDTDSLAPGDVRVSKKAVHVGTADVDVALGTVQAPGKKAMAAADWARGLQSTEGLVLQ